MCGGNARELASWGNQNEFSNHFYWNSSAAGSSLKAAKYVDLKKMQLYFLAVSLDSLAEIPETVSATSCTAHFLAFHIFPPLLPSITRSWKGKLLPLTVFFILCFYMSYKILQLYKIASRQHRVHWISCLIYFEQITLPLNFCLPGIISADSGYQST